jgi:hypothetical protein
MSQPDDEPAAIETKVRGDRTILTIEGWPEASVIVRSESGERIYLPPEDPEPVDSDRTQSPYSSGADGDDEDDDGPSTTPYSTAVEADEDGDDDEKEHGRSPIRQGIRIVHPEPVTDVRVLE